MKTKASMFFQTVLAMLVRFNLMCSPFDTMLHDRIEISTPLNSWRRATEAVYLLSNDINPYTGDQFHEPPHNLYFYKILIDCFSKDNLSHLFIVLDIVTSIIIYITARKYLLNCLQQQSDLFVKQESALKEQIGLDCSNIHLHKEEQVRSRRSQLALTKSHVDEFPMYCVMAYLFNPFCIINCAAQTTTVFSNLMYACLLCAVVYDQYLLSMLFCTLLISQSLYPVALLVVLVVHFSKRDSTWLTCLVGSGIVVHALLSFVGLSLLSTYLCGSWAWLDKVYRFILQIDNLQPNIGLFWYFFTEMFEHFHHLFLAVFQINIFILYTLPLSVRFRRDPVFLLVSLLILITIFKSYPTLGDVGFYLSLLPMWFYLLRYLQQAFLVIIIFLIQMVLGPVVWHLWITAGTANANFYFGVTLSFAAAQIFLLTDFMFSYVKRDFWLRNRCSRIQETRGVALILE